MRLICFLKLHTDIENLNRLAPVGFNFALPISGLLLGKSPQSEATLSSTAFNFVVNYQDCEHKHYMLPFWSWFYYSFGGIQLTA